ncbi:MAG: universal stress protein [Acidimicrobiales bacterium]|nr:universal stress protein [Acidimicrobiales bacterium]RZV48348.1 MAG: hypothetical protein EX269_02055 [Acidimicrobiales bacterium]
MTPDKKRIVVGYCSAADSLGALRHGISLTRAQPDVSLVVVHAASVPIAIKNGPSEAIATQLGNPDWATVYTAAVQAGAPVDRTTTIVGSDRPVDLLSTHTENARLVLLGPKRRRPFSRRDTQRSLQRQVDCPVIRIPMSGLTENSQDLWLDELEVRAFAEHPDLRQAA